MSVSGIDISDNLICLPFQGLGVETNLLIFSFLNTKDHGKAARVSKIWYAFICNVLYLKKAEKLPFVRRIDQRDWESVADFSRYGISFVGKEEVNYFTAFPILEKLSRHVEDDEGVKIALIDMPQGLNLDKLIALAGEPKRGNKTGCQVTWERVQKELGDRSIDKPYTFFCTLNLLNKSEERSFKRQEKMAANLGCEVPMTIEAAALCFLTYILSKKNPPTRLFSETYGRCKETINGSLRMNVGHFGKEGVGITYFDNNKDTGVAAVLRPKALAVQSSHS